MGTFIMRNNNGFTLIELLFVLVIVSTIALFVLPSMYRTYSKQQTKHLLQVMESDVFLIQNHTLYTLNNNRIFLDKDHYIVQNERNHNVRTYPHDLRLINAATRIRFSTNGTVYDPTGYMFQDEHGTYKIVFPFGKGRFYIDE